MRSIEQAFGEYVRAAAIAEHMVVTTARSDAVLRQAYFLDELASMDDRSRPTMRPAAVAIHRPGMQPYAIGEPFPADPVVLDINIPTPDPLKYISPRQPGAPQGRDSSAGTVQNPSNYKIDLLEFAVPHPSFLEISLDDHPHGWMDDQHGALGDSSLRSEILRKAWAAFRP